MGTPGNLDCLAGGEMGRLMRAHDWSATPLGPVEDWPQSLKTAVRIMLGSRYPMFIWWGKELVNLYNDGYLPMLGKRHPAALGKSAAVIWSEIWDTIGPQTDAVLHEGRATWNEERLLVLERNGYPEEAYFTFSYSPIPADGGGIGGIFCALTEDTQRVLGQRRMRTLRELSTQAIGARTVEQACQAASDTLARNPQDLPFTLIYLLDSEGKTARLAGTTGLESGSPACPPTIDLASANGQPACWPLDRVVATGRAELVGGLEARCGRLRCGVWPDPPDSAVVLPVMQSGQDRLAGFLVTGISPRRVFDDDYRGFTDLLAGHIATAITNARAYEEEKRRAEALAELDRAKTAFFSNVSHEFRTPLTLILGPVEDALAGNDGSLPPPQRARLEIAHRNGLRLQRLVNTLLDFSRIEAGRVRARYEPTDLATFTADLASNFRSACDGAGLELVVDCPPLPEPVYVDREMWEKVVLNLLSNAFKFTLAGEIEVRLRPSNGQVRLSVRDTGTGIPVEEMPRLFERFHRVEGSRGRSQEGSGIGLALVRELVKLHGGSVDARSEVGRGTTFLVTIPLGTAHLPRERIGCDHGLASTATGGSPFVEEALRWLPDQPGHDKARTDMPTGEEVVPVPASPQAASNRPRVLVADDNADMRQYIVRLLADQYVAEAVPDGEAALASVRRKPPDLILSDVMMPRLDGFGLLREVRADPRTAGVPVILLSARAGEESQVEGMRAGADDYLVKPFSARELLARVSAHLQMARLRRESERTLRESEQRFRALVSATSDVVYRMNPDWTEMRFLQGREFLPDTQEPTRSWLDKYIHPDDQRHVMQVIREAVRTRSVFQLEHRVLRVDGTLGWTFSRAVPLLDAGGEVVEWFGAASDVTARKRAEEERAELLARLETLFAHAPIGIALFDTDLRFITLNERAAVVDGVPKEAHLGKRVTELLPELGPKVEALLRQVRDTGEPIIGLEVGGATPAAPGQQRHWLATYYPVRNGSGKVLGIGAVALEITGRKRAEAALRQSESFNRTLLGASLTGMYVYDVDAGRNLYVNPQYTKITGYAQGDLDRMDASSFLTLFHAEDRDAVSAHMRKVVEAGPGCEFETEYRFKTADGRWAYLLSRDTLLPPSDGSGRRFLGTFVDITGRRRAEDGLRRHNERLRLLSEAASLLLHADDPDVMLRELFATVGPHLGVDAYFNYMVDGVSDGLRLVSSVGLPEGVADSIVRLDFGQAICGTVALRREPVVATHVQLSADPKAELVRSLGIRAYVCNPLMSGDRLLGTLSFASRSRDQFDAEELEFVRTISHHVTVAYERVRLVQQLRQADRRKDEFLATLAHELRNPLAPIRNAVQVVKAKSPDVPELVWARDLIERQVGQMARLLDDLLDVSRITRSKLQLRKGRITLAGVLESAVETSRPVIDGGGHQLTVKLPTEPVHLDADPVRLAQVFANLLNNAAKYTDRGGHIWLTAGRAGHEAVVSVKDDGIGIERDVLPHLFEMFSQATPALERSQGGLGIGLSLVKGLVEMHGGRVAARSDGPGRGSEFVVRLPVAVAPRSRQRPPAEADNPCRDGRRIVVADDNRDAADSLAMMLTLMGNEVRTANDGEQAVEVVEAFRPDVVLLDIGMPRLNGYEACRRIREQPWGKSLLIVALTGWGQEEDRRRSQDAGFNHHLVKPVDPAALKPFLDTRPLGNPE